MDKPFYTASEIRVILKKYGFLPISLRIVSRIRRRVPIEFDQVFRAISNFYDISKEFWTIYNISETNFLLTYIIADPNTKGFYSVEIYEIEISQ